MDREGGRWKTLRLGTGLCAMPCKQKKCQARPYFSSSVPHVILKTRTIIIIIISGINRSFNLGRRPDLEFF